MNFINTNTKILGFEVWFIYQSTNKYNLGFSFQNGNNVFPKSAIQPSGNENLYPKSLLLQNYDTNRMLCQTFVQPSKR